MKLFVAVLGLAAVAAAGVVVDHPVEHPFVKPVVQPAEKSAMVVGDPHMKLESDVKMIKFYSNPNEPAETHALEMGGMKKVLNGPVMVAFKDAVEDKMNIFLLPYGLKALNVYNSEEAHPLVQFLNNGRQKSFMYLSAGSHLQLPEMLKKLDQINLPAFNLNTVVRIAEHSLPVPYILVVDTDTLQGNSRVADLKELGVFKMDKGVLEIVRDNYPHEEDLVLESRSFGIVPPVNYEYEMPTFADKDLLREHVRPVLAERGLIRKYKMPVFAEKDLVGEYVKPIYTEWDLDSEYGYVKPIYAKHYPTDEYAKAMMVDKDSVRDYERDVIRKYVKPDLVSEYVKPFYTERDLLHEYL